MGSIPAVDTPTIPQESRRKVLSFRRSLRPKSPIFGGGADLIMTQRLVNVNYTINKYVQLCSFLRHRFDYKKSDLKLETIFGSIISRRRGFFFLTWCKNNLEERLFSSTFGSKPPSRKGQISTSSDQFIWISFNHLC